MTGGRKTQNTAIIDGQAVKVHHGQSILDAAQKAGIYIPTLCHLDALDAYGGCRLCAVKVKDMRGYPTACTTPIAPGMEVETLTPELQKLRKEILEFTLSEHPFTCLVCKDKRECTDFMHSTRKVSTITGCNFCTSNGDCELQELVDYLDLEEMKFPITYRGIPPVKDNPFYDLDYNLCVLCGRCVRICNEERNSNVLAFVERGNTTIVGTAFNESQAEAGCEFCGACVDVCPTGSISEKMGKWRGIPNRSVKTTCVICPVACDMNINTSDGKIVQIGAQPGKRTGPPQLCLRGKFLPPDINGHPDRITSPLIRRENKWVEVSWKEAFETTARKLENHRGSGFGLIASGQDTLEDNYMLQKFTRKVMHSNNVDMHGSYPQGDLLEQIHRFRSLHSPAGLADIEKADTLLLLGLDASVSHPLLENRIRKAFREGKKVIYFGTIPTRTSFFVTTELMYKPGTEESLLLLLLSVLDPKSVPGQIAGVAEELSGIQASELAEVCTQLMGSKEVAIVTGDDQFRHPSSGEILQGLFSLHAAISSGPRCHIIFPGYEGNLYSSALVGLHPRYLPGFEPVQNNAGGLSCNEMIRNTGKDGITALMVIGDLPLHPGLDKLEVLIQCNMFLTEVSEYADVVLPVSDFLENEGHVLSMNHKLKKANRAIKGAGDVKSIARIISGLAKVLGESGFSQKPAEIFREIRSVIDIPALEDKNIKSKKVKPDFKGIRLDQAEMSNGYPVRMMLRYNHFRYRGNQLTDRVPDLRTIAGDGDVGLPVSLMKELKVKEGERVRIISEDGEMTSVARSIPGLNGTSACLYSNGSDPAHIYDGVYPDNLVVSVKIEKEKG